jgi:hypothetical protein
MCQLMKRPQKQLEVEMIVPKTEQDSIVHLKKLTLVIFRDLLYKRHVLPEQDFEIKYCYGKKVWALKKGGPESIMVRKWLKSISLLIDKKVVNSVSMLISINNIVIEKYSITYKDAVTKTPENLSDMLKQQAIKVFDNFDDLTSSVQNFDN